MSRSTLRPVAPQDNALAAAALVQALRDQVPHDEVVALVDEHLKSLLGGQYRPNSAADFRAFLISVAGLWIVTAQLAAQPDRPHETPVQAASRALAASIAI